MEALFDLSVRTSHAMMQWAFNGLWLGLLITGLLAIILLRARKTNAATRYGIWWLTLAAVLFLPFFLSGAREGQETQSISEKGFLPAATNTAPAETAASVPVDRNISGTAMHEDSASASLVPALLPHAFVFLWVIVSFLLISRLFRTYFRINRIKKRSLPFVQPEEVPSDLPARLRVSDEIHYPMAAGLGDPMILIPRNMIEALAKEDLLDVILHEAAHIVRRDDWTLLLQKIVQAVFFILPAVHWIGRHLDLERELACDDLVVERTRMPVDYCRCLARLMELTRSAGTSLAPAALTRRKQIMARFERILRSEPGRAARFSRNRFAAATGLLSAAVLLSILAVPAVAVPLGTVTLADLKACLEPDSDEDTTNEKQKIFIPPELVDRLVALPEGKIVDWTLKIYSLPISFTLRSTDGEEEVATIWINEKKKLRAVLRGSVRFTEDDRSIESISSPGFFSVLDERGPDRLELEVKPGPILTYYLNGRPQALDERACNWVADVLLTLIRRSGAGAIERAARILQRHGVDGLIGEVPRLESPWVQEEYLAELIRSGKLTGKDAVTKVLDVIAALPDINKVGLLIDIHPLCRREGMGEAHNDTVKNMESRYERQQVIDALK